MASRFRPVLQEMTDPDLPPLIAVSPARDEAFPCAGIPDVAT